MGADWVSVLAAYAVALVATLVVAGAFALGVRLLPGDRPPGDRAVTARAGAAVFCFALAAVAAGAGVVLFVQSARG